MWMKILTPRMDIVPGSIYELYELLCRHPKSGELSLSITEFITERVRRFTYNEGFELLGRSFCAIIDGKCQSFFMSKRNGITIATAQEHMLRTYGALMIADDIWLVVATRGKTVGLCYFTPDEKISPPIDDDATMSILHLIPDVVILEGECCIIPYRDGPESQDVTFFPSDFPHSAPLTLPEKFVRECCDRQYHAPDALPDDPPDDIGQDHRKYNMKVSSITEKVSLLVNVVVDNYALPDCDRCCKYYSKEYDQIKDSMELREYVTFIRVMQELGVRWDA